MVHKRITWVFALAFFALSVAFTVPVHAADKKSAKGKANAAEAKGKSSTPNTKVAAVNGKEIMQADVDKEVKHYTQQMAATGQEPDPAQLTEIKKKVLDGLIERELLLQESTKLGIKVPDSEVDEQISSVKNRFPSETEFKAAIGKMNVTEADLKVQIAQGMAIKKVIEQEVSSKVAVTPEDSKAFYDSHPDFFKTQEKVRASHVLIKVDEKASDEDKAKAREKITQVKSRLDKGEDFATVAKEVSECPSAPKGGDLDYFQRGQMVGPFEEAAFSMNVGQTSDIIQTQFGFHVIKVTDKKPAGTVSYDEAKDKIGGHLKQEKVNGQITTYLAQLKSQAKVETFTK
jgi:peptidyl-prolyl cis-trans isomerase C